MAHERTYPVDILYEEEIGLSWSVRLYILTVYAILFAASVAATILDPQFILLSQIVLASLTVVFLLLYSNFRTLRIRISRSQLEVRYGRFQRKVIPVTKMVGFEHIQIRLREYGGVGIRWGRDGTWAYNTRLGDTVRVTIPDDRPFAFSTAHPERVCELLQELRQEKEGREAT